MTDPLLAALAALTTEVRALRETLTVRNAKPAKRPRARPVVTAEEYARQRLVRGGKARVKR